MVRLLTTRSARLRISIAICAAMFVVTNLHAQHAFEYAARVGANALLYQSDYGKPMPNYNVGMDFSWKWRSPHYIGARVGIGADVAASTFIGKDPTNALLGYSDSYMVAEWYEPDGDVVQFDYQLGRFSETQQVILVSVPAQLGLYFGNFSVFFGGRIGTAVHGCYWQRIQNANVTLTFPFMPGENGEPIMVIGENTSGEVDPVTGEILNAYGFREELQAGNLRRTVNGIRELQEKSYPKYDYHFTLMFDLNYSFKVGDNTDFALGAYLEYDPIGYEPKSTMNTTSLMEWHYTRDDHTNYPIFRRDYGSVLESYRADGVSMRHEGEEAGARIVNKYHRASVGLRLSVSLWNVPIDFGTNYRKQQTYKKCMCDFF